LTSSGQLIPIFDPATTRPNPAGAGLVRDPFPNNLVPSSRFDPIARKVLAFWPQPNRVPTNPFTFSQNFQDAGVSAINWSEWLVKLDHRFTENNAMFFRYIQAQHVPSGNGNVGRALPDVRTPGTLNFDFSAIKDSRITERLSLQFRAESFNFLNHVNLGAPNTTFRAGPDGKNSSGTFGVINSARDARVIQFGMKLIF